MNYFMRRRYSPRVYRRPAAPLPPRTGYCIRNGRRYPCTLPFRDADLGAAEDSTILLFGMVPVGIAVAAGFYIAFRG